MLLSLITLGSNSFNMLIVKTDGNNFNIIGKYKQKVRLAEGLKDNSLSAEAIQKGLECFRYFAKMLEKHSIQNTNIVIKATATLRKAKNNNFFKEEAFKIISSPIEIISGDLEADFIYKGAISTTNIKGTCLVIDIGGASTELVIGKGENILFKISLDIGCVIDQDSTYSSYPSEENFLLIENEINNKLSAFIPEILEFDIEQVLGNSGIIQTIFEILDSKQNELIITKDVLLSLKNDLFQSLDIPIKEERKATFFVGLSLLIIIFLKLKVKRMEPSNGALREGIIHSILIDSNKLNV